MTMACDDSQPDAVDEREFRRMLCARAQDLAKYIGRFIPADLKAVIDADDVAQDALIAAATAPCPAALRDADVAWRWLATIARNRLANLATEARTAKRGGKLKRLAEEELRHGSVIVLLQDLAIDDHTPSRSAARREFLVVLEESLIAIQPSYRDAIQLRYIEGQSLLATAKMLGRTPEATRKLCVRGLEALREELRRMSLYV